MGTNALLVVLGRPAKIVLSEFAVTDHGGHRYPEDHSDRHESYDDGSDRRNQLTQREERKGQTGEEKGDLPPTSVEPPFRRHPPHEHKHRMGRTTYEPGDRR